VHPHQPHTQNPVADEQTIHRVAVLGAGTMGNGIAQVCAMAGYAVALHDPQAGAVERALGTIRGNLDKGVERGPWPTCATPPTWPAPRPTRTW
jgi:predicted homoserine dehydrogenase-like protein